VSTLTLSNIKPDWQDIVAQLQAALPTYNSWKDFITSSTGQTIVEMIATVGAYDQFAIESAFQELFPISAKLDSSIYAIAMMLGVRLTRKAPAEVSVTITSTYNTTIPIYSQFTGAGSYFFNRSAIILLANTPQAATLYQGSITSLSFNGIGTDFQAFVTQEDSFTVSDSDVQILINNVAIPIVTDGLWSLKSAPGVQDLTQSDGRAILQFGNANYGSSPGINDVIQVLYAVTAGQDGNNLQTNGVAFTYEGDTTITVSATTSPSGGANEDPAIIYKSIAAPNFGSFSSAVTKNQYASLIFEYPGIVDGLTFAQREINPQALQWMNNIKLIILTSSVWTQTQYDAFAAWMNARSIDSCTFVFETPVANVVNVNTIVYCSAGANLTSVTANVTAAVQALFQAKQGILNEDYYLSDLYDAIKGADPTIQYATLSSPTADMVISKQRVDFPVLTGVSGGTLTVGQYYDYAIGFISTLGGEVAPANWQSLLLPASTGSVTLTWTAVPNVSQYRIWGRQSSGTLGLIATVSNTTFTYTDTGSVSPVAPLLAQDTTSTYYNSLGTLTVAADYSTRLQQP